MSVPSRTEFARTSCSGGTQSGSADFKAGIKKLSTSEMANTAASTRRNDGDGTHALSDELHGLVADLVVLALDGVGLRSVWTVIQTCLILGSVLFATGLLGEQIAGQRAEVRELRRQIDEVRATRQSDA